MSTGRPVVFPPVAEFGDTVAMAIDSSYTAIDGIESHGLTIDDVQLKFLDLQDTELGVLSSQDLRAVFDGHAAATSTSGATKPGFMMTAVLFDVPVLPITPSEVVKVRLLRNGQDPGIEGLLEIDGTNGSPINFLTGTDPAEELQPLPALRLRALKDPQGLAGFDPAWEIGSLEFTLTFASMLSNPRAFPANEATGSLALVGPAASGAARVVLIAPKGLVLGDLYETSKLGEGPFLDVVFNASASFGVQDLGIVDLHVYDKDGGLLTSVPNGDGSQFFDLVLRGENL